MLVFEYWWPRETVARGERTEPQKANPSRHGDRVNLAMREVLGMVDRVVQYTGQQALEE